MLTKGTVPDKSNKCGMLGKIRVGAGLGRWEAMEPKEGDLSWKPDPEAPAAALIYVTRTKRHLKSPTAFPGCKRVGAAADCSVA